MDKKQSLNKNKNPIYRVVDLLDYGLSKVEELMLIVGVIGMATVTIASVIARFIFNDALTVNDELNMIFIIIVTFAGLSYAARNARHIRMSAIYDTLPPKIKKGVMIFICAITAAFMFALCYYSYLYIVDVYKSGRTLPALGIPAFYIYLWVPVGFAITGLQYSFTIIKNIRSNDIYLSTKVRDGYCETEIKV